ncbi:MAG TPA: methyltransferase domain-containing protein [Smithellaceae bacterium]|nr:methyltransferase domain-containing protein [Smithellaceae bacterium]
MTADQAGEYVTLLTREVLNPETLSANACAFRFQWASALIDSLIASGFYYRRCLDVGAYNGRMSILMAKKRWGADVKNTIAVDAVDSFKDAYESLSASAETLRKSGFDMTAHNIKFEDYKTDKLYDAIFAFEVLEHMQDPLFCIEKMYDMLEIGGDLFITVPEERGAYGLSDKNCYHYWASTVQSLVSVLFYDDRKWSIKNMIEQGGLIHMRIQKRTYME